MRSQTVLAASRPRADDDTRGPLSRPPQPPVAPKSPNISWLAAYLAEYTGATKRFFDTTISSSADVRLSFCSQADIFRYLLNYVRNYTHYSEQARNCQTFAADFFALLSGQHSVEPFSTVNRLMYKRHLDWFLCDPPKGH